MPSTALLTRSTERRRVRRKTRTKARRRSFYWQQNTLDAEGQVTQETAGIGLVTQRVHEPDNGRLSYISVDTASGVSVQQTSYLYDQLGNRLRSDDLDQTYDTHRYDKLNRLTKTTATANGVQTVTDIAYDAIGNIQSKTGVGIYSYGDIQHKHAVTQAGSNSYAYDNNGNLTAGAGRTVDWTAWNMLASATETGNTTSWAYDPEHSRYKMTTPGRTTWYRNPGIHTGGHYEQTQYASGTVEHRVTLYGGGKPIGEVITFDGGAPSQTRYFHSDAQGSITAVTNQAGQVITRYRYDPWGWQTLVSGSNTGIDATRQGHTGHEMLDGGLTHMNGRLYDPVLSRFVSADPIVDNPFDLQSLNRYSYVTNNPLYYTDPSGFSRWTDFRDGFLKPVVSIAAAAYLPGSSFFTSLGLTGTSGIIAAGAVSGAISGGGRGALMGAVSAGMFSQLHGMEAGFGKVLAHGVAGGMMSEMQGGSFKSGFLAAGFTQGASQLGLFNNLGDPGSWNGRTANAIGAAIVGGTASVIGGGKFANGAMTGAFSRLFNDLACYRAGTCAGKVMNTKASCGANCQLVDTGAGGKMWVRDDPELLSKLASVKSGNLNGLDDLTTTSAEFSKQLAVGASVTGLGAFGGAIAGVTWAGSLGTASFATGFVSVFTNPAPSAYDYFTLGVGARAQMIDYLAPGASLVNQGTGLILDGIGWSLPGK